MMSQSSNPSPVSPPAPSEPSAYLRALADRVLVYDGAMGTNIQLHHPTPEDFVTAVKGRRARGLTWIKFDVRPSLFETGDSPLIGHDAPYETEFDMGRWFKTPPRPCDYKSE